MMIDKVFSVLIILVFSSTVSASWFSQSQQQHVTPPKTVQQILVDKKSVRCEQKLKEYNELVRKNSDSDYYRYLLDNWKRDCQ